MNTWITFTCIKQTRSYSIIHRSSANSLLLSIVYIVSGLIYHITVLDIVPHPSIRVLWGLVVVPDAQSSDGLSLVEDNGQSVGLSIGERDQPHVLVISCYVVAVYQPG